MRPGSKSASGASWFEGKPLYKGLNFDEETPPEFDTGVGGGGGGFNPSSTREEQIVPIQQLTELSSAWLAWARLAEIQLNWVLLQFFVFCFD